jgi:hypothetical protein
MNALIIKGNDKHTERIQDGLTACDVHHYTITSTVPTPDITWDIVFIDPSVNFNIPNVKSKMFMFFDTEDATNHFEKGQAYDQYKDKVLAYAKYNYEIDDRKDGIKNIGIPLSHFFQLSAVANAGIVFSHLPFKPYLLSSPTFIGSYNPVDNGTYSASEDITCLGKYDDGGIMYNQRYDWLLSLRANKIKYEGGIVFSPGNNLSIEWQSKYFGSVDKLKTFPLPLNNCLYNLLKNKIGLNPTGHERISWRTFDIMATGAILFNTDTKNKFALLNPKEYITKMKIEEAKLLRDELKVLIKSTEPLGDIQ